MCNFCSLHALDDERLNAMTDKGAPVTVTWAFKAPYELLADEGLATPALRQAAREAAKELEKVAGIQMVEVDDFSFAMIDIAINTGPEPISFAYLPLVNDYFASTQSDLIMYDGFTDYSRGSVGFEFLLHEFGHAVGLDHPFEGPNVVDPSLDNTSNTVMSYTKKGGYKDIFKWMDRDALQDLYGAPDELDAFTAWYDRDFAVMYIRGSPVAQELLAVNDDTFMRAGGGDDTLWGRDGYDTLIGEKGDDLISGLWGDDVLIGRQGDDTLKGAWLDDVLIGNRGNDWLFGGADFDLLDGGAGRDRLHGGSGDDTLFGGLGRDTLIGADGADTFVVGWKSGRDVINDFDPSSGDQLDVSAFEISRAEALARLTISGADDLVFAIGKMSVTLAGGASLSPSQDMFVV